MKTWIVSDWHLGETRFDLMGRPFTTQDEHINALIKNHNALIAPDDEVIVVGDVCYQKTPEFLPRVAEFNGIKTLVRGNHDRVITDEQFKVYFKSIIDEGKGFYREFSGIPCYITHYPTEGVTDAFNLVGHIHSAWKYQLNMLNVGIDVHHFRPVNLETVPFHFNAVSKFYDRDVWVGYEDVNAKFRDSRGKKDSYFRPLSS